MTRQVLYCVLWSVRNWNNVLLVGRDTIITMECRQYYKTHAAAPGCSFKSRVSYNIHLNRSLKVKAAVDSALITDCALSLTFYFKLTPGYTHISLCTHPPKGQNVCIREQRVEWIYSFRVVVSCATTPPARREVDEIMLCIKGMSWSWIHTVSACLQEFESCM